MPNSEHLRFYVPSNSGLQHQLIKIFHDSPQLLCIEAEMPHMLCSQKLSCGNWIRCCPSCIKLESNSPAHGPMHVHSYKYPFSTLVIDFAGELPISSNNNKWLLTCVCPFPNYLISIPLPDKTATIPTNALFKHVFLKYGFLEILNAVLHLFVKLLSTTTYRLRMNGSTECVHRCINSAPGIFCENHQNDWEQFIQPATYVHNISPIPGSKELSPFFLLFGRDALSLDAISLQRLSQHAPNMNKQEALRATYLTRE